MEERRLNRELKQRAIELGLCEKWQDEWEPRETKRELIGKFLRGIDFCIKHDYPSIDYIKENFPSKMLEANGVFVDSDFRCDDKTKVVVMGESSGEIRCDGMRTVDCYVRHRSRVTVRATYGARVFVEVYDDAELTATADTWSKVFVYRHGGNVTSEGNVTVRDRR